MSQPLDSIWGRHGQTIIVFGAAIAVILGAAFFHLREEGVAFEVALIGSVITIFWFRKAKPITPVGGKRNRTLLLVAVFYPLAAIALAMSCLINGWRWWCPLLIFPIWAGVVCWRFVNQSWRLSIAAQPHQEQAAKTESEEKPDESNR